MQQDDTSWSSAVLSAFQSYISSFENSVHQAQKSMELFKSASSDLMLPQGLLKWFPDIAPSSRNSLLEMINLLSDKASHDATKTQMKDDVIQSYLILVVLLQLFGEHLLAIEVLNQLETLLQKDNVKGKRQPLSYVYLITVKLKLSMLLCEVHEEKSALKCAKEAITLCKDCEQFLSLQPSSPYVQYMKRKLQKTFLDCKLALLFSLALNNELSEACTLIDDIIHDDFISAEQVNGSRRAAFASACTHLVLSKISFLLPIENIHALDNAVKSINTTCECLERVCPGIQRMLTCQNLTGVKKRSSFFNHTSKDYLNDVLLQLELVQHFLASFHHATELWLKAGDLKFSLSYISNVIALCRELCLPEREFEFQLLLMKYAIIERNVDLFKDELKITNDTLHFIDGYNKEKADLKRTKIYSTHIPDGSKSDNATCNLNEDEIVRNILGDSDVTSSDPVLERELQGDPGLFCVNGKLKQMAWYSGITNFFAHQLNCDCRICTNMFLVKCQYQLALHQSEYLELLGDAESAILCLKTANKYLHFHKRKKCIDIDRNSASSSNAFSMDEVAILNYLARIYYSSGDSKSSEEFVYRGLSLISGEPAKPEECDVFASLYLNAAYVLLSLPLTIDIDPTAYLDAVLDVVTNQPFVNRVPDISSKMKNLKISASCTARKQLTMKLESEEEESMAAVQTPNFDAPQKVIKFPSKTPKHRRIKDIQPPSVTKQVKSSRKAMRTKKAIKQADRESDATKKFIIFDEEDKENDVKVSLKDKDSKSESETLPLPDLCENASSNLLVSATGEKKSRRVVFNFSEDESENEPVVVTTASDQNKTPARTRRSRRIAQQSGMMTARKLALKKYREEYRLSKTTEDIEDGRPVRRKRQTKSNTSADEEEKCAAAVPDDVEEIEYARESTGWEKPSTPLSYELNSSLDTPFMQRGSELEDLTSEHCLEKTLKLALMSGNTHLEKEATQLLSVLHEANNDTYKACAYHAISIGLSSRINNHHNLKCFLHSLERAKRKDPSRRKGDNEDFYVECVKDMIQQTTPQYIISQCLQSPEDLVKAVREKLPERWTVCMLSTLQRGEHDYLLVTQLRRECEPVHLQLNGGPIRELNKELEHLLNCNDKSIKLTERSLWWTQRRQTNKALDELMNRLGKSALGIHAGILLGLPEENECRNALKCAVEKIMEVLSLFSSPHNLPSVSTIQIYVTMWKRFNADEKTRVALHLLQSANVRQPSTDLVLQVVSAFGTYRAHLNNSHRCRLGHVVLILDKGLQTLPWESSPILHRHSVSRMPSVETLLWQLRLNTLDFHAKVDLRKVSYVLNPKGDLGNTENRFADWFKSIQSWSGTVSRVPSTNEWMSYISASDVFIYCGHGSGSAFVPKETIARRRNCACALLMGCESGRLEEKGITEPRGVPLSYVMSGSPCVLACLWKVTDKDIDRYLAKCLSDWMKAGTFLTDIIRGAEVVCKLPRLNGAACVIYGIPVQSTNSADDWTIPQCFSDII